MELLDPATQSFAPLPAFLNVPRMFHSAALLQSGRVMMVGGVGLDNGALDSAEIFDPATLSFDIVPAAMTVARLRRARRRWGQLHRRPRRLEERVQMR